MWGMRVYGITDWLIKRCYFWNFGLIKEGHGMYADIFGSNAWENCLFDELGGQGVQLVFRKGNAPTPRPVEGTQIFKKCRFKHNTWNPDRGASQLAIYNLGSEQDVIIEDSKFICDYEEIGRAKYKGYNSKAAITIVPVGNGKEWWQLPDDTPFTQNVASIRKTEVYHTNPERSVVNIKGCRVVEITDCIVDEGVVDIDHPSQAGRKAEKITVLGCSGNATLRVGGKVVGPISQDYTGE
jgi:hypothetical protein